MTEEVPEIKKERQRMTNVNMALEAHRMLRPIYTIRPVMPENPIFQIVKDEAELKKPSEPWQFKSMDDVNAAKELEQKMHDYVTQMNAYAVCHRQLLFADPSGNLVSGDKRVICVRSLGCLFNPKIIHYSDESTVEEEGTLSHPFLYVKVRRPFLIRVRFTMANGQIVTERYNGITARLIQQYTDMLDGKMFYDTSLKIHKDQAFRKQARELKRLK